LKGKKAKMIECKKNLQTNLNIYSDVEEREREREREREQRCIIKSINNK